MIRTVTVPPNDLVDEYGLGRLIRMTAVAGGGPQVRKMITAAGSFVVKPAYRAFEWDLYATVEKTLNDRGVRQARIVRTAMGSAVSSTGHVVLEWLDGSVTLQPSEQQVGDTFRHLAHYTAALSDITIPTALITHETIFTQVVSAAWLEQNLSGLCQLLPDDWDRAPIRSAQSRLRLTALPVQLVHGDIGPDNVVYDGETVVAIIDFTPFPEPALFGLCTALYWFFVHGREEPDLGGLRDAVAAYATIRPLTPAERAALPAMLIKESLRRLATPLALAEADAAPVSISSIRHRYQAVVALTECYADLSIEGPGRKGVDPSAGAC